MNRIRLGGALLLGAAAFLGREALIWAFNKTLDAASSTVRGGIHFFSLSWQNGAAALLALCGLVLIAWPRKKALVVSPEDDLSGLWISAENIIRRVRSHRSTRWYARDRLEPSSDIARDGAALLVTFEKAGFKVPVFHGGYAEQVAVGLEAYFSSLVPLMRQQHIAEAKNLAPGAAQRAVSMAKTFKPESEWFYPDF